MGCGFIGRTRNPKPVTRNRKYMKEDISINEHDIDAANGAATEEAAAASAEAAEAPDEAVAEIERLQAELQKTQDQLMRQAAEFRNYKRRTEAEKQQLVTLGQIQVVQQLLDVYDDFGRSLDAVNTAEEQGADPEAVYATLKQGVELVYRKLSDEMTRLGVEPIEAVGQPFDEHLHEAMMQQPAPEGVEPGTVLQEMQTGYRMNDRILRHSKVIVAS